MSRFTRLVLGGAVALLAAAPLAPAHAITCTTPATQPACTTYGKVCSALSTHDQLHQLLCTLN
jgi:hypothetical protein